MKQFKPLNDCILLLKLKWNSSLFKYFFQQIHRFYLDEINVRFNQCNGYRIFFARSLMIHSVSISFPASILLERMMNTFEHYR